MDGVVPVARELDVLKSAGALDSPVGARLGSVLDPTPDNPPSVDDVAKAFEQMLMEMMVRSMRKTVQSSELFGPSLGGEHYVEFLDSLYVEMACERGDSPRTASSVCRRPTCLHRHILHEVPD